MKNKCSNIKIKIYITMQCQSPYVFINKDIYTRISICTFYTYIIILYIYVIYFRSIKLCVRNVTKLSERQYTCVHIHPSFFLYKKYIYIITFVSSPAVLPYYPKFSLVLLTFFFSLVSIFFQ